MKKMGGKQGSEWSRERMDLKKRNGPWVKTGVLNHIWQAVVLRLIELTAIIANVKPVKSVK